MIDFNLRASYKNNSTISIEKFFNTGMTEPKLGDYHVMIRNTGEIALPIYEAGANGQNGRSFYPGKKTGQTLEPNSEITMSYFAFSETMNNFMRDNPSVKATHYSLA